MNPRASVNRDTRPKRTGDKIAGVPWQEEQEERD
jgi:hypothetical protein